MNIEQLREQSATPRTDDEYTFAGAFGERVKVVPADFARTLERELIALQSLCDEQAGEIAKLSQGFSATMEKCDGSIERVDPDSIRVFGGTLSQIREWRMEFLRHGGKP